MSIFYAASAVPGHKHWEIGSEEGEAVAELSSNIIRKRGKKSKAMKAIINSLDLVALTGTLIGIIAPRAQRSYEIVRQGQAQRPAAEGPGHAGGGGPQAGTWPDDQRPDVGVATGPVNGAVRTPVGEALAIYASQPLVS
jgi:hypothetical protein